MLAQRAGRPAQENALRRKRRPRLPQPDPWWLRLGAARKEAGPAFGLVTLRVPQAEEAVTRQTFPFALDQEKRRQAEQREGHSWRRSPRTGADPAVRRARHVPGTPIEAACPARKSELGLRPISPPLGRRVDAHRRVAFRAEALWLTRQNRGPAWAPGLRPRAGWETRASIQLLDVIFPSTDGRPLVRPRYTQPAPEQKRLLQQLQLRWPDQPPPRIQLQPTYFPPACCSCRADLLDAAIENKALSRSECPQLRKFG